MSGDTAMSDEQEVPNGIAKPRARKIDGDGGSNKKRAKKADGDGSSRHGGLGGLFDDEEDSADRRAVENLVEAARGNIGKGSAPTPQKPEKVARKKNGSGSRGKGAGKAASNGIGGEAGGGAAGALGGLPQLGGAASLLGSLGLGALQLPSLPQLQQLHNYQELRKSMEQQVCLV